MNKMVDKNVPVIFQNIEQFEKGDSRFVKVKIWLMHLSKNLNGSIFNKESVEKAIPSLANTPILAFIEENSEGELDYSDHRMVLHRKKDGDITVKYLGQAVGIIPETNNAQWEKRVSDNGEELEYLTVEGLMWTKFDDPIDIIKRKGFTAQSMELAEEHTGYWNDEGYYVFEDFLFNGACLLGDDVLPAMRNSTVEMQFSKENDMRQIIENKLMEFNSLFSEKQGGKILEQNTNQEFETTVETEVESQETTENVEVVEEITVETEVTNEVVEQEFTEETQTENTETEETVEESTEDTVEEVQDETTEEFETITEETQVEEVIETTEEVQVTEDVVETVNEFEVKYNNLVTEFENAKAELETLRAFKRETEEAKLSAQFEGQLTNDELTQVFEQSKEVSIEDIEKELYALVGKKNFSAIKEKPVTKIAVDVNKETKSELDEPYGGLFAKFSK